MKNVSFQKWNMEGNSPPPQPLQCTWSTNNPLPQILMFALVSLLEEENGPERGGDGGMGVKSTTSSP